MPFAYFTRSKRSAAWIPDTHPHVILLDMMNDAQAPVHAWCAAAFGPQGARWFVDGDRIFLASQADATMFRRKWR